MRKIFTALFLAFTSLAAMAQESYIQVVSDPGLAISLDGVSQGKTKSDIGGLIINNVQPGSHRITVVSKGCIPQVESISVKPGEVFVYRVRQLMPELNIKRNAGKRNQSVDSASGIFELQSLPVTLNIKIPGLKINSDKTEDEWTLNSIPAGSYPATFTWKDKTLNDTIVIRNQKLTHLFVDMIRLKAEDRSPSIISGTGKDTSQQRLIINFNKNLNYGSLTDPRDGRTYRTIQIGNQTWMAENLAYLPDVSYSSGRSPASPYYYVYGYQGININEAKSSDNYKIYGVLYNFPAAENACPSGWHLPGDDEWKELEAYIGMSLPGTGDIGWRGVDEAYKLMENGTEHWEQSVENANSSGFTALPGGILNFNGEFSSLGKSGYWWSSTPVRDGGSVCRLINSGRGQIFRESSRHTIALSVRCIKD